MTYPTLPGFVSFCARGRADDGSRSFPGALIGATEQTAASASIAQRFHA